MKWGDSTMQKTRAPTLSITVFLMLTICSPLTAQTAANQQRYDPPYCETYAREKARANTGGVVGGAVAGAVGGAAVGHIVKGSKKSRKQGAAIGAVVGGTAGASDREARFQKYYHGCLNGVFYN
jgi:outer membrane lipoprotein SlyB